MDIELSVLGAGTYGGRDRAKDSMVGWRTRSDDDLPATVVVMVICDNSKNASALKRQREETLRSSASKAGQDGACDREESQ